MTSVSTACRKLPVRLGLELLLSPCNIPQNCPLFRLCGKPKGRRQKRKHLPPQHTISITPDLHVRITSTPSIPIHPNTRFQLCASSSCSDAHFSLLHLFPPLQFFYPLTTTTVLFSFRFSHPSATSKWSRLGDEVSIREM